MKTRTYTESLPRYLLLLATLLLFAAGQAVAQVPVDDEGNPLGEAVPAGEDAAAQPQRSMAELEELVGRIALYPDDLLAIVLPASTYPLEIVQAARFLDAVEDDSGLTPDESWDESVTALLNYPEVLNMMNDDIDWTWQLGEAVVAQQSDVVAAVEVFRDRAYAAGNLQSDEHQTVSRNDDVIEIEPVNDDVIYVPYYEPEQVVVYQPRRVYYYYPRAYPVYYYPYPVGYHFGWDHFWGVTTAFRIGWTSNYLHVYHHSFHGHPYFGHHYYGHYWRQPSIYVFNSWYGHHGYRADRYRHGSYWRPRHHGGARPGHSQARSRYYANHRGSRSDSRRAQDRHALGERDLRRDGGTRLTASRDAERRADSTTRPRTDRQQIERRDAAQPIRFRAREERNAQQSSRDAARTAERRARPTTREQREQPRRGASSTSVATPRARIADNPRRDNRSSRSVVVRQRTAPTTRSNVQRAPTTVRPRVPTSRSAPPPQRAAPVRRAAPSSNRQSTSSMRSRPAAPARADGNRGRRDAGSRRRDQR